MAKEAGTWKKLREWLPRGHASRIESEVGDGFPDVHFTQYPCISVTFELKYADGPKKSPLKGKIRASQRRWIREEIEAGGKVWVVAEFPDHHNVILFISGRWIDLLEENTYEWLHNIADLRIPRRTHTVTARILIEELLDPQLRKPATAEDKNRR